MKNLWLFFILLFINLNSKAFNFREFKNNLSDFIFDETYKTDPNFKRHNIEIESGVVLPMFNDAKTNKNTGDLLEFTKIQNSANPYVRFSYYFNLDKKNSFRVLIAPLSYSGSGYVNHPINYENMTLQPGSIVNYQYQFNSYRFTYRRTLFQNDWITFRLGLTLKIRDAYINVYQGNNFHKDSNVGFVPLGYINLEISPIDKLIIGTEGDSAGAPQGSAIDVGTFVKYKVHDNVAIGTIYRFVYGGAQTDTVYNYAFFNYYGLLLSITI